MDYHTIQGSVVMATGRHQWNIRMSGERCSNIKVGVVVDGDFKSYNKNLYERQCEDPCLVYYCTGEQGRVFDTLTGGENSPQRGLGTVDEGQTVGVILDFNEGTLQFTRQNIPVGEPISGISGKCLRACICLDYEGEAGTLEGYSTTTRYDSGQAALKAAIKFQKKQAACSGCAS